MREYDVIKKSPFFKVMHGLNKENLSDHKVGMVQLVDMSSAERLRKQVEAATGVRPTYTSLVIKAVTRTLNEQPHANRIRVGLPFFKRNVQLKGVDMTVAVERDEPGIEQAAFAGTIESTDEKNIAQITEGLRELANATPENCPRWRQFNWIVRKLPAWLALKVLSIPRLSAKLWIQHRGGAVMVSSPAKYGADMVIGAWPWPLGFSFGFVKRRPIDVDGQVESRPTMYVTFSFDRRLMAGAPSARFFQRVCEQLENAESELMEGVHETSADHVDQTSRQAG